MKRSKSSYIFREFSVGFIFLFYAWIILSIMFEIDRMPMTSITEVNIILEIIVILAIGSFYFWFTLLIGKILYYLSDFQGSYVDYINKLQLEGTKLEQQYLEEETKYLKKQQLYKANLSDTNQ